MKSGAHLASLASTAPMRRWVGASVRLDYGNVLVGAQSTTGANARQDRVPGGIDLHVTAPADGGETSFSLPGTHEKIESFSFGVKR